MNSLTISLGRPARLSAKPRAGAGLSLSDPAVTGLIPRYHAYNREVSTYSLISGRVTLIMPANKAKEASAINTDTIPFTKPTATPPSRFGKESPGSFRQTDFLSHQKTTAKPKLVRIKIKDKKSRLPPLLK